MITVKTVLMLGRCLQKEAQGGALAALLRRHGGKILTAVPALAAGGGYGAWQTKKDLDLLQQKKDLRLQSYTKWLQGDKEKLEKLQAQMKVEPSVELQQALEATKKSLVDTQRRITDEAKNTIGIMPWNKQQPNWGAQAVGAATAGLHAYLPAYKAMGSLLLKKPVLATGLIPAWVAGASAGMVAPSLTRRAETLAENLERGISSARALGTDVSRGAEAAKGLQEKGVALGPVKDIEQIADFIRSGHYGPAARKALPYLALLGLGGVGLWGLGRALRSR